MLSQSYTSVAFLNISILNIWLFAIIMLQLRSAGFSFLIPRFKLRAGNVIQRSMGGKSLEEPEDMKTDQHFL